MVFNRLIFIFSLFLFLTIMPLLCSCFCIPFLSFLCNLYFALRLSPFLLGTPAVFRTSRTFYFLCLAIPCGRFTKISFPTAVLRSRDPRVYAPKTNKFAPLSFSTILRTDPNKPIEEATCFSRLFYSTVVSPTSPTRT